MNPTTTISSFVLSLWKHVANTSFSTSASLHIGRLYERQNCLLQLLQVRLAPSAGARVSKRGLSLRTLRLGGDGSLKKVLFFREEDGPSRGMMVLLVKQVHLQNEVGAR